MKRHEEGSRSRPRDGFAGYAAAVGSSLRNEFGDRRFAAKVIGRWTGAGERTAKAWLSGSALPNGRHLIVLMAHSDAVLATILAAARRVDLLDAFYAMAREAPRSVTHGARHGGPGRGTVDGTDHDPVRVGRGDEAPELRRQRWFVSQLSAGAWADAAAIRLEFGVSWRTAKRDIAALKRRGVIRFEGSCRRGHYSLARQGKRP